MRRFTRAAQTAALALIVSLSLAACGDKDTESPSGGGDSSASAESQSGGGTLSQGDFNQRMFSAIEKAGSAHVHFETGTGGKTFGGDGEIKYGDELALRMKMAMPSGAAGGPQEVLLIGDTFYIGMGDRYMAMPLDAMSGQGMPDLSTNLDPKVQAKAFDQAVTSFKQGGEAETLDGVKATPYDITIDPTKAPDTFGTTMTEPLTFTYFVGPDDLPRKMVYHSKDGEFTATYTDWGAPVDIEAPPADKVMKGMH
jgi:lipoprotein LprG